MKFKKLFSEKNNSVIIMLTFTAIHHVFFTLFTCHLTREFLATLLSPYPLILFLPDSKDLACVGSWCISRVWYTINC